MKKYNREFELIIKDIASNNTVKRMKNFNQHYDTNCFEHCIRVSYISYLICKKLKLNYKAAARAGMLHDLFLYDWRKRQDGRKGLHAFTHPKTALENSTKLFELSDIEKDIILKHMWPVTIKLPKYKESHIVTLVDKYSAITESLSYYYRNILSKKTLRLAYVFLSLFMLDII